MRLLATAILLLILVLGAGSLAERPSHCIFLLSKKRGEQRALLERLKELRDKEGLSKSELPVGEFGWDVPLHRGAIEKALGLKEHQLPLASTGALAPSGLPLRANRNRPALGLPQDAICYYLLNEWARRADHKPLYFPYGVKTRIVPPEIRVNKDGTDLILIPVGDFWMGSTEGEIDELPPTQKRLPPYLIGKTEVTVAQFRQFVADTGYVTEAEERGFSFVWQNKEWQKVPGADWRSPNGQGTSPDSYPVRQVTIRDCEAYCEWAGGRLPSEQEWEKAARGNGGWQYPWGNDWDSARAVFGSERPQGVGSLPRGSSPFGLLDTAGNVREWTGTRYEPYDDAIPVARTGVRHAVRGGSWNEEQPAHLRVTYRYNNLVNIANDLTGFRLAQDYDSNLGSLIGCPEAL